MRELITQMREWLSQYIKSFYSKEADVQRAITMKELHTNYVVSNCIELAKFLNLSAHETFIAEIIGLFHDVGRFEQYSLYKTFNDANSIDHAELALKILDKLEIFKKLNFTDYKSIRFAIQNHNKMILKSSTEALENLFAKIIRDADKLDVYRILVPEIIDSKEHTIISPDFIEDFMIGKQANYEKIQANGDMKIIRLMWIYDINFSWTMKKIIERDYIEKIISSLPINEKITEGVRRLKIHMAKKCNETIDQEEINFYVRE